MYGFLHKAKCNICLHFLSKLFKTEGKTFSSITYPVPPFSNSSQLTRPCTRYADDHDKYLTPTAANQLKKSSLLYKRGKFFLILAEWLLTLKLFTFLFPFPR